MEIFIIYLITIYSIGVGYFLHSTPVRNIVLPFLCLILSPISIPLFIGVVIAEQSKKI